MNFLKRFFSGLLSKTPAYEKAALLEETLAQKEELLLQEIAKLHQENEKRLAAAEERKELLEQELTGKLFLAVRRLEDALNSQQTQHGGALKSEMVNVSQELQKLRQDLDTAVSGVEKRLSQTVNDRVDQLGAHVQNQTGLVTAALQAGKEETLSAVSEAEKRLSQTVNDRVDQLGAHVQNQTNLVTSALQAGKEETLSAVSEAESRLRQTVNDRVDQLGAHVQNQTGLVTAALQESRDASISAFHETVSGAESRLGQKMDERADQLGSCVQTQTEAVTHAACGQLQQQQETLNAFRQEAAAAAAQQGQLEKENLSFLFKNGIECRWQVLDALDHLLYPADFPVTCTVCHHTDRKDSYQTCVTHCRFNGGRLERFICPVCGAIFGPLKMMTLTQEQLADEYRQGYHTFSESNTTALELDVFQSLGPSKEGIYLNFGAGAWNKTTEQLRAEGFQVYDYEPYAPVDKKPWVFTTLEEASQFKYNGIFSNDLIEHLRTPGEDLKKMVAMMTDDGMMVHGSGCYDYAFEYTRFHLTFFTGNALEYLGKETGLGYELGEHVYSYSPYRKCKFFRKTN